MNNYKINPDYALPPGLAIGMEGIVYDPENGLPIKVTLVGYDPVSTAPFLFRRKDNSKFWDDQEFTPLQPWQPKPGDRRTGELVWGWYIGNELDKHGCTLTRYYFSKDENDYSTFDEDGNKTHFDCIAKVYDIDKEFGMTIKEIIDSRKPSDVLGVER